MDKRTQTLVKKLRARDCRITPQRLALLELLFNSQEHPSAIQLYDQLRPQFPTLSLATVYKTLNLLKEMGEVREIGFSDGDSRYDAVKPFSHAHLMCTQCHSIVDADVPALLDEEQVLASHSGYKITGHRFDFFGICPKCQAQSQSDGA